MQRDFNLTESSRFAIDRSNAAALRQRRTDAALSATVACSDFLGVNSMEEMLHKIALAAESVAGNIQRQTDVYVEYLEAATNGWREAAESHRLAGINAQAATIANELTADRIRQAMEHAKVEHEMYKKVNE